MDSGIFSCKVEFEEENCCGCSCAGEKVSQKKEILDTSNIGYKSESQFQQLNHSLWLFDDKSFLITFE